MTTLIDNVRIVLPGLSCTSGSVLIECGKIAGVYTNQQASPDGAEYIDGGGALLSPGLIDLHTHGLHHFLYEQDAQHILDASTALARYGTTCVLPTLYTCMKPDTLGHLAKLTDALNNVEGVSMPGFHLEGPFLKLPGAGADTFPGDVTFLNEILDACKHKVCAMSISPDTPNIMPVIDRLHELGISIFITHTQAGAEESVEAIERGARHGTHFYDVFYSPQEYEPGCRPVGVVEALLADPRCTVDFICDGVHVKPLAIKSTLAAKGWQGIVLITDSNIGAGLEPGIYDTTWGHHVKIKEGDGARIHLPGNDRDGMLAGSTLTMDCGINNLNHWLDLPIEQIFAMGTLNPARVVGLKNKGDIRVGADADLVLWNQNEAEQYLVARTWSNGKCVYNREMENTIA